MYLRAGVFSLGLLLLSRLFGLLRESAQAAAFGSSGMADVVIVMFTLPDLLVGILVSGALSYVLLPVWAQQSADTQAAGQKNCLCAGCRRVGAGFAGLAVQRSYGAGAGTWPYWRHGNDQRQCAWMERRRFAAGHAGSTVGHPPSI